jgi:hypothetical protein
MQSFKEYLLEFVGHSNRTTTINGVPVTHTNHGADRNSERTPHMTEDKWKTFHERVIAKADKCTRDLPHGEHEILFHSPSMDHAAVYNISKNKDGKTTGARVITTLPKGKSRPKEGTKKFMVESIGYEIMVIEID